MPTILDLTGILTSLTPASDIDPRPKLSVTDWPILIKALGAPGNAGSTAEVSRDQFRNQTLAPLYDSVLGMLGVCHEEINAYSGT
jgi:hypothetical protein